MRSSSQPHRVARATVLRWFTEQGRAFPWRQTRDPYRTLVAEVMLQQTQTSRVVPAYARFLSLFPDVHALAGAPVGDVIHAWSGLGYNRRAVNLHRAARVIVSGGAFPRDAASLRALPGVGAYTSSAVACFAFDAQVPVVDVNVRRVLARMAHGSDPADAPARVLDATAAEWLPPGRAYEWNQALMDVGATMCRAATPVCGACPLRSVCAYRGNVPRSRTARANTEPFHGSRRQLRGAIVECLRRSPNGMTIAALQRDVAANGTLAELLSALERDGLVALSPAAKAGSPRGFVKLP